MLGAGFRRNVASTLAEARSSFRLGEFHVSTKVPPPPRPIRAIGRINRGSVVDLSYLYHALGIVPRRSRYFPPGVCQEVSWPTSLQMICTVYERPRA